MPTDMKNVSFILLLLFIPSCQSHRPQPFPVVEGEYQMTKNWSIVLPGKFNRRIEEDDLVLWRPGITLWIAIWGNDHDESRESRLASLRKSFSADAFDVEEVPGEDVLRISYRLNENSKDNRTAAFYGFVVGFDGHVQIAIYFDQESDLDLAKKIFLSLREKKKRG